MANLTQTAYYTRKGINIGILALIGYVILRIVWSLLITFWLVIFPPKPPPPNYAFNVLPKIVFPPPSQPSKQLTYTLETISGDIPQIASDSARVYFMPKKTANLLALENTKAFAKRFDFVSEPTPESRTVYRFTDTEAPFRSLSYDIISDNFFMRYLYDQDLSVFANGMVRDTNRAQQDVISQLQALSLYTPEFQAGPKTIQFQKLVGNTLQPTTLPSEASAIKIDFFRSSLNSLPIVTSSPNDGQISAIVTNATERKKRLIQLIYTYWPIDQQNFATYSLKPVTQAWEEVQNNTAYIAQYPTNGEVNAVIRSVKLAYYDSFEPQQYLQPIYIFEGDFGVMVYVHAIPDEWVAK